MKTQILKPTLNNIAKCSKALESGQLVGMPTETVYGLAANAFDTSAVEKIFVAKNRPQDNPLIVHIHKDYNLLELVEEVNQTAKLLLKEFTPGPLTLVLKSKNTVSSLVSRGLSTIAVRIPSHEVCQALLKQCNLPLAAPSANISSHMSATTAKSVKEELNGKLPFILDGGKSDVGIESTVVDATGDVPIILRPGKITKEQIEKVCGNVEEIVKVNKNDKVASPGMKYKHYSPVCPVEIAENVEQQYLKALKQSLNPVIVGLNKNLISLKNKNTISLGETLDDYSQNLYEALRVAEKKHNYIFIFKVENIGFGRAIMNRVNKMINNQNN